MKNYFNLNLKGSQIAVYFLLLILLPSIVVATIVVATRGDLANDVLYADGGLGYMLMLLAFQLALGLCVYAAYFFIFKRIVESVTYKGESLRTEYDFGKFFWILVKGYLLTIITIGIYSPWFFRNVVRYFSQNTYLRDQNFGFKGKPSSLLAIWVLLVMLPIMLFFVLFAALMIPNMGATDTVTGIWTLVLTAALLIAVSFFYAMAMKWFFNFGYGVKKITTTAPTAKTAWFFLGQACLIVITLCLYYPMFIIRVYRYVVNSLVLGEDKVEDRFGFENKGYFWYFFGQFFLTIITCGIYWPWAFAKVCKKLVDNTSIEIIEDGELMPAIEK